MDVRRAEQILLRGDGVLRRNWALDRIRGTAGSSFGDGYESESPEDILIALLRKSDLDSSVRASLELACDDDAARFLPTLASARTELDATLQHRVRKTLRVIELGCVLRARSTVRAVLGFALDQCRPLADLQIPAVRCLLALGPEVVEADLWARALENATLAPYGFRAFLRIDPSFRRAVAILQRIWHRCLVESWSLDVVALTYLLYDAGGVHALDELLRALEASELWPRVLERLLTDPQGAELHESVRRWRQLSGVPPQPSKQYVRQPGVLEEILGVIKRYQPEEAESLDLPSPRTVDKKSPLGAPYKLGEAPAVGER